MKSLMVAWFLAMFPLIAFGTESNPLADQCYRLANLNGGSQVFQHFTRGGFWKNKEMVNAYLLALHGQIDSTDRKRKTDSLDTADRAGVVLAAIVNRDPALMARFYDGAVAAYFINTGWSVMTFAASCDFEGGISFLLKMGADPNAGSGIGPFNASLVNGNSPMAQKILEHGYMIEHDPKRCQASKFIVAHSRGGVFHSISSAVDAAVCKANRKGRTTERERR